jgi:hypothetical protein
MVKVIVVRRNNNGLDEVLLGKSSRYLMDINNIFNQGAALQADDQRVVDQRPPTQDTQDNAFNELRCRINGIKNRLRVAYRANTVIKIPYEMNYNAVEGRWSGRYRQDVNLFPIGFIKGNNNGEDDLTAGARELKEETGVTYPVDAFTQLAAEVVGIHISHDAGEIIKTVWRDLHNRKVGEIFGLNWYRIDALPELNDDSQRVRGLIPNALGLPVTQDRALDRTHGDRLIALVNNNVCPGGQPGGKRRRSTRRKPRRALRKTRKAYI